MGEGVEQEQLLVQYRRLTVDCTEKRRLSTEEELMLLLSLAGKSDEMLIGIMKPHPSVSLPSKIAEWIASTWSLSHTIWSSSSLHAVPFFNSVIIKQTDNPSLLFSVSHSINLRRRRRTKRTLTVSGGTG